jgi:hypothetical protein
MSDLQESAMAIDAAKLAHRLFSTVFRNEVGLVDATSGGDDTKLETNH